MFNSIRADIIASIRNGYGRKTKVIQVRFSNEARNFLEVLKNEGYIEEYKVLEVDRKQAIAVTLSYYNNKPSLKEIKLISKPGQRRYVKKDKIPVCYNRYGCYILSTNKGIMTSHQAENLGIGGELIAYVF